MSRRDKIALGIYIMIGIALIIIGLSLNIDYYSTLLFAMGFALAFNSLGQLVRYYHHTRPENIEAYKEKLRQQSINLKDERKIFLRNKSGYITWAITMICCFVAAFIAALLRAESIVIIILMVSGVAEYAAALAVYKYLDKKM